MIFQKKWKFFLPKILRHKFRLFRQKKIKKMASLNLLVNWIPQISVPFSPLSALKAPLIFTVVYLPSTPALSQIWHYLTALSNASMSGAQIWEDFNWGGLEKTSNLGRGIATSKYVLTLNDSDLGRSKCWHEFYFTWGDLKSGKRRGHCLKKN
jgi:hypothetical protein